VLTLEGLVKDRSEHDVRQVLSDIGLSDDDKTKFTKSSQNLRKYYGNLPLRSICIMVITFCVL
jgi:hypothetical protein